MSPVSDLKSRTIYGYKVKTNASYFTFQFIGDGLDAKKYDMIINLGNISYEICKKYPIKDHLPAYWPDLSGEYRIYQRLPGNKPGDLWKGDFTISTENGLVMMSNPFGPIIPLSDKFIRISSGAFAGEIMEYFPLTGSIIHQNAVFIPSKNE